MSARMVFHSAAASLTAFFAAACTITTVNNTPDSGGSSPDTGMSPDPGTSRDAGLGSDVAPSADGSANHDGSAADGSPGDESPGDGSPLTEASVVDGSASDAPSIIGNGCSDPAANNQTPATATPYTLGTSLRGCLRSAADVNYYSFTVPTTPPKGGYVVVKVSDVGLQSTITMAVQATSDGTELVRNANSTPGGGVALFFAAAPGATFGAVVKNLYPPPVATPNTAYTLTATYTGVDDRNAPNGTVATAATFNPATPAHGYFFAGYSSGASPPAAAWESWYQVTLPAGTATIALTNVASDATGKVEFFDGTTKYLNSQANSVNGGNVQFDTPVATAGAYYLRIQPLYSLVIKGIGASVPVYMAQPWTLTVTSH